MAELDAKKQALNDALKRLIKDITKKNELLKASNMPDEKQTKAHILMLLAKESLSNSQLAANMQLSKPAITKATKELTHKNYLIKEQSKTDKRRVYYTLTTEGKTLALSHQNQHLSIEKQLLKIINNYNANELATITKFVDDLSTLL